MALEAEIIEARGKFDLVSYRPIPQGLGTAKHMRDYNPLESRNLTLKKITKRPRDENISVIGIWGAGVVGKTTLAMEVARQVQEDKLFDVADKVMLTDSEVLECFYRNKDAFNSDSSRTNSKLKRVHETQIFLSSNEPTRQMRDESGSATAVSAGARVGSRRRVRQAEKVSDGGRAVEVADYSARPALLGLKIRRLISSGIGSNPSHVYLLWSLKPSYSCIYQLKWFHPAELQVEGTSYHLCCCFYSDNIFRRDFVNTA
ncbi:hypothetical protein L6164_003662 [Bauhinia variegata]|uniref:Uncharacterized protein n=1 Tax=Bauhinia variegata TaxID=167791 RepID=A0ACB9Q404_BAUVA|nr:hypothetical protein L6164_003662 [Bauhinia variegata]